MEAVYLGSQRGILLAAEGHPTLMAAAVGSSFERTTSITTMTLPDAAACEWWSPPNNACGDGGGGPAVMMMPSPKPTLAAAAALRLVVDHDDCWMPKFPLQQAAAARDDDDHLVVWGSRGRTTADEDDDETKSTTPPPLLLRQQVMSSSQNLAERWMQMGEDHFHSRTNSLSRSAAAVLESTSSPHVMNNNAQQLNRSRCDSTETNTSIRAVYHGGRSSYDNEVFASSSCRIFPAVAAVSGADLPVKNRQDGKQQQNPSSLRNDDKDDLVTKTTTRSSSSSFANNNQEQQHNSSSSFLRHNRSKQNGGNRFFFSKNSLKKKTSMLKADSVVNSSNHWRTAVDPKTGRTYYYHAVTRACQWHKPVELTTPAERMAALQKERRQREFFKAMEANILKSMQTPGAFAVNPKPQTTEAEFHSDAAKDAKIASLLLERPNLVRTISSMDQDVLNELVKRQPSHRTLVVVNPNDEDEDDNFDDDEFDDEDGGGAASSPTGVVSSSTGAVGGMMMKRPSRVQRLGSISENHVHIEGRHHNSDVAAMGVAAAAAQVALEEEEREVSDSSFETARQSSTGSDVDASVTSSQQSLNSYGLPNVQQSTDSLNSLGEEMASMGLNEQETKALQQLASITQKMGTVVVDDDDDEDLKGLEFTKNSMAAAAAAAAVAAAGSTDDDDDDDDAPPVPRPESFAPPPASANVVPKPRVLQTRRNTCGTLYVSSTMSAPDKDATIQCVCAVYRAHILQSHQLLDGGLVNDYHIFNDLETQQQRRGSHVLGGAPPSAVPSLQEVHTFYADVFKRAQMESDCIIMSLVYVERLIKTTMGGLRPRACNWRSVLFSCMVLASKVWDDMSMWNADFSQTCPAGVKFTLSRVNELEVAVLEALRYNVKVPASEYAKYYFLLRSMLIKSGLSSELDIGGSASAAAATTPPLDLQSAKRLQMMSSRYQKTFDDLVAAKAAAAQSYAQRAKSMGGFISEHSSSSLSSSSPPKVKLEHFVAM